MPRRPRLYEAGLFMVVVVVPLAFIPFSTSPFGDLKLVLLAVGVLLLWASAPVVDRRLELLAGCWFAASVLGAVFGVDPGRSITGTENAPGGVALVLLCAYLVSIGAAMPRAYRDRLPTWVASAAGVVAAIVIVWRLWPGAFSSMPGLSFGSSTLGAGPFMAAFIALGLIALPHLERPMWQVVAAAVLFGLALGGTPHRAALISTVIGFVFSVWNSGAARRLVAAVAVSALIAFLTWGLWPSGGPAAAGTGGDVVLEQSFTGKPSGSRRLHTLSAIVSATGERPVFGWGPGNTLSAWLAGAQPEDFPIEEQFTDAHNIVVEQVAATGFLGALAFLALITTLGFRILKRPRPTGWLAGAVVVMVLLHLVQPMNVAMTSLGFLLLGVAAASGDAAAMVARQAFGGAVRAAVGVLLVCVVVVSLTTMLAAVIEQYEHTYYTPDHGGLQTASRLVPWRIKTKTDLAIQLALDGRSGNEARATEAVELARLLRENHPDDPGVYLVSVQVYKLVMDPQGAVPVIQEFKVRFPLLPPPTVDLGSVGPSMATEPVG